MLPNPASAGSGREKWSEHRFYRETHSRTENIEREVERTRTYIDTKQGNRPKWGTIGRAQGTRSAARLNDVLREEPFGP
jgi:hypothetical protein